MKKHNYKFNLHCTTCWDKCVKRLWKRKPQPDDIVALGPVEFKKAVEVGIIDKEGRFI